MGVVGGRQGGGGHGTVLEAAVWAPFEQCYQGIFFAVSLSPQVRFTLAGVATEIVGLEKPVGRLGAAACHVPGRTPRCERET